MVRYSFPCRTLSFPTSRRFIPTLSTQECVRLNRPIFPHFSPIETFLFLSRKPAVVGRDVAACGGLSRRSADGGTSPKDGAPLRRPGRFQTDQLHWSSWGLTGPAHGALLRCAAQRGIRDASPLE